MAAKSHERATVKSSAPQGWLERVEHRASENYDIVIPVAVALVVFGIAVTRYALPSMVHDAYAYTMAALRLVRDGYYALAGGELPGTRVPLDARVTPGYILFLSAFYGLLGRSGDPIGTVRAVQPMIVGAQFVLALGTVAFLTLCGRELGGRRLGLVTGLLGAVYLPFAWASTVALSESLAGPLIAAQLWWALRLTRREARRSVAGLLGFGAYSAAIVMVRPSMVLWALVPLVYVVVTRLESPKRLAMLAGVAVLGFVLVFAPWWVRNVRALDTFVPIRSDLVRGAGGQLESIGTDPPPALSGAERLRRAFLVMTTPWSAPDDAAWENAFHYDKARVDFGRFPTTVHSGLVPWIRLMRYYQFFLLAAAAAALLFVRRSPRLLLAATVPLYAVGIHAAVQVTPRYAFLGMPALIVLAGAGAYGLWHRFARRAGTP
jgi:4-amino-4-deoxy-L-arabinose transferase-like glycosyltransferase